MPKVSVIIPSFNHALYIQEAINSVLTQSMPDLELLVIDDGSTDDSVKILKNYTDPRLKMICQANQGAHAAINRGLELAQGEHLSILNSDDAYHPQRLEKALAVLQDKPETSLVGSHIRIVNARNRQIGIKHDYQDSEPWPLESPEHSFRADTDLRAALLTENFWSTTSNYFFSRTCYESVGAFRSLRYTHDWDYALRLARLGPMHLLPEALLNYRVHASNTIRENQAAMIFEICWILAVHLPEHISDAAFFNQLPAEKRVSQLLHSIYTFEMGRVLNAMLLQRLHQRPDLAMQLLQPDDPTRQVYLEYILKSLGNTAKNQQVESEMASPKTGMISHSIRWLKQFVSSLSKKRHQN
ncbi:MAG: glycosyltransferase [Chloroflexota bacterium]